jgi:hypothetical protein
MPDEENGGGPAKKGELAEVERALSVLAGRDPEAVRAQREAQEAAKKKRAEIDARSGVERKRVTRVALVWAAVVAVLLAVAGVLVMLRMRASTAESAIAKAIAPYVEMGFARSEPSFFSNQMRAELDVAEDSCVLAVPTPETPKIHFDAPGMPVVVAKGTLLHCTCASAHVGVWAERAGEASAVALLRVDARAIGGRLGAAFLEPKPQTIAPGGEACAAEHLESYVREGRFPKTPPSPEWKKGPLGPLEANGFSAVARVPPDRPLAMLQPADGTCFVAFAGEGNAKLVYQGTRRIDGARLGWCGAKLGVVLLERDGGGGSPIDVVAAPARRIGGLLGLERLLGDAPIWAPDADHAAMAAEALHACLVPDTTLAQSGPIQASASPGARVVALSIGAPLVAETRGERSWGPDVGSDAFFLCSPVLAAGVRDTVCVQGAPQTWHPPGPDVPSGAAFGSLPAWLGAWGKIRDPDIIRLELELLDLAMRLSALGYEATIIEGITEDATGVSILGRAGEDALVAIGIWPSPPWVEPYGEPAWKIDGAPSVVPIAGGKRIHLPAADKTNAPIAQRRTVVFRHAAR